MKFLRNYFSLFGCIAGGLFFWRMMLGSLIWAAAFLSTSGALYLLFPAYISAEHRNLQLMYFLVGVFILLYIWLSLTVQRARDIGYSPIFAAGCFLGCFFVLPTIADKACLALLGSNPVCSGGWPQNIGMFLVIPLFVLLCFRPSNSFKPRRRRENA